MEFIEKQTQIKNIFILFDKMHESVKFVISLYVN